MPITPKQEKFAQCVADGMSQADCRLILNKWGNDVSLWLAAWHSDCIKGFGGVFEAACFYFQTRAWMQERIRMAY